MKLFRHNLQQNRFIDQKIVNEKIIAETLQIIMAKNSQETYL